MIEQNKIEAAAQKWAIDTRKKFAQLSEQGFIAGAKWAIEQIEKQQVRRCDNCGREGVPVVLAESCPHCYC